MISVPLRRPRGESRAVDDTYLGEGDLGSGHSVTLPLQHRALVPPSPSTPKILKRALLSVAVFLLVFYAFSLGQRLKVGNVDGKRYAFDENAAASSALDLVIVAGHAVLNFKSDLLHAGRDDSCWQLLPYQKKKGMPEAILGHIRSGIGELHEPSQCFDFRRQFAILTRCIVYLQPVLRRIVMRF